MSVLSPRPSHNPITPAHAAAAIVWLDDMSTRDKWDLSVEEVVDLLGGISPRTFYDWRNKATSGQVNLSRDCLERLSLLLGISKALQIVAPSGHLQLAYSWFNKPNDHPIFGGLSIKEYLIQRKTIEALYTVRRYLDAARG